MNANENEYLYLPIHQLISASDCRLVFACLFVMKHSANENLVDCIRKYNVFDSAHLIFINIPDNYTAIEFTYIPRKIFCS